MNYFNHQWKKPFKIKQDKQGTKGDPLFQPPF